MTIDVDRAAYGERRVSVDAAAEPLLEQAKGVLIFRYATDAAAAGRLLEIWAREAGVSIQAVAATVVHEICQGRPCPHSATWLVRWLESRLRQ